MTATDPPPKVVITHMLGIPHKGDESSDSLTMSCATDEQSAPDALPEDDGDAGEKHGSTALR